MKSFAGVVDALLVSPASYLTFSLQEKNYQPESGLHELKLISVLRLLALVEFLLTYMGANVIITDAY